MIGLLKWNKINTAVEGDNQHLLMRVPVLARMPHNVQQTVSPNRHDIAFEGHATDRLECLIHFKCPAKRLHQAILWRCVPFVTTRSPCTDVQGDGEAARSLCSSS